VLLHNISIWSFVFSSVLSSHKFAFNTCEYLFIYGHQCDERLLGIYDEIGFENNEDSLKYDFQETTLFWSPTPEMKACRLKRSTVSLDTQEEFESEK